MGKVSHRLGRLDWVLAGFRALVQGGAPALRVEPVAKAIGATKGSFYWHFEGPREWHAAMMSHWQEAALQGIIAQLDALPPGRGRLLGLFDIVAEVGRAPEHGGLRAEAAIRGWAAVEPTVAAAVEDVDRQRHAYLHQTFAECGLPPDQADRAARLIYALHVGQEMMGLTAKDHLSGLMDAMELVLPNGTIGPASGLDN